MEPTSNFGSWEIKTIDIHNFLDLPDTRSSDNVVESPRFKCFGHLWRLEVHPGGDSDSKEDGWVSMFIRNLSDEKITINGKIVVLLADGSKSMWSNNFEKGEFGKYGITKHNESTMGFDIVKRATLIESPSEYFVNGALKIQVQMRLSNIYDNMNIFKDDETSDLAFDLKGEIILAHKCIIKSKAKDFYVMCEGYNQTSPMPIMDVAIDIFEIMLKSLYGGDVYPEEWNEHSEAILKAASKYGFTALESEADVWCAKSLNFTVDNVISKFMEADGNNHARVKAAAKEFIMDHKEEVVASESLNRLYESKELTIEVMQALASEDGKKRKRES
eukprot:scaffold155476_cov20-Cyclotella_meneghiniana.AAC.2